MSGEADILKLGRKIAKGKASIDEIAEFVSLHLPAAVNQVNELFSP